MKLIIDADACPVKESIIRIGEKNQLPVALIHSISHISKPIEGVEQIIVDNRSQAADLVIMNKVKKNDIVITQDYGLASVVLSKGAYALHHTGMQYTPENIDQLLFQRHISAKIRRGGGKTKGPKPFTAQDKEIFEQRLIQLIETIRGKGIIF